MNPLPLGQCATLASLLEVSAPKVGNVHRGADFANLSLDDFLLSAVAIGPAFDAAPAAGVGATVLTAIQATRRFVSTNTNLGMMLLMAPLAVVPRETPLAEGVGAVLSGLTPSDARDVYAAIGLAQPGGLGQVDSMDVAGPPPDDLLTAMAAAAERDTVARQYATQFELVLGTVVPWLLEGRAAGLSLARAIVHTQLRLLELEPDSLIARKCGQATAHRASAYAAAVLRAGEPLSEEYERAVGDFDFWARSDGNRRNPGTTADLIAAGLFAALRDGQLAPPFR